ncbi:MULTISPECIES: hypothetical protein [Streptomyces]|uniref:hypothetical protein n=1 Tax=Streptomyces TaxID=1883 RepID=UPI0014083CC7|nr:MULTISPECIES: hypothetical protein [Streptomyces]MDH6225125.1 hypothetical protein [Streptomyces sp. MJP52]
MTTTELFDRALVEEAAKKSALVWVRAEGGDGSGAERALWHVWHDGAVCLVGDGPGEQPLPGLADGGHAVLTLRSKDKGGRLVTCRAAVTEPAPGSPAWEEAVAELKGKRLNAADAEAMPERWARECRVLRLEPLGAALPQPSGPLAAAPPPTAATTREPVPAPLPRLLFRRRRR